MNFQFLKIKIFHSTTIIKLFIALFSKLIVLIIKTFLNLKAKIKIFQAIPQGPITLDKNGNVAIKIQAKPGAKHNNVTG